ncbi:MAG TPA: RpiB/LacA/LacB family sugar-phosphate isomerase [Candidatus Paceibacterota bacterium]|nr:RpiB/LacA/LacB family sugar-phosphate isomerase [Candidatus Paceibacterota bacterium]
MIYIGSDHAGYELKEKIKQFLVDSGYEVEDKGAFNIDVNDDYPDFIVPVAKAVASNKGSFGIILGGSGEGEQISANKIDDIRAIEYYGGNLEIVKLGREHNNANILSLGARFIEENEAKEAVKIFLETEFKGDERHVRRINKINEEEK